MGLEWSEWFQNDWVNYIYCALFFCYCCIVLYNEIIIQLTIMHNQWEPWACFPELSWYCEWVMGNSYKYSWSFAHSPTRPLTSCCVAWFLTGHELVEVHCPRVGDPCFNGEINLISGKCFRKTLFPVDIRGILNVQARHPIFLNIFSEKRKRKTLPLILWE